MGLGLKKIFLKTCDRFDLFPLFNIFTRNKAAVFMLHHFGAAGLPDGRSLNADTLEHCLRYVADNGYKALSLSEYVRGLQQKQEMYKSVVFTVDDGYNDFLHYGFPIFSKFNIPVAVFITTDFIEGNLIFWWDKVRQIVYRTPLPKIDIKIGNRVIAGYSRTEPEKEETLHRIIENIKYLPRQEIYNTVDDLAAACGIDELQDDRGALVWSQIDELAGQGVEFFPHTHTHPILSQCSDSEIREEISESRNIIASHLHKPADIFCYPNGRDIDFDDRVVRALKKAGYIAAFTSEEGFDRSNGTPDMYRLHRYALLSDTARFKQVVSGLEALKTSIGRCIKN